MVISAKWKNAQEGVGWNRHSRVLMTLVAFEQKPMEVNGQCINLLYYQEPL